MNLLMNNANKNVGYYAPKIVTWLLSFFFLATPKHILSQFLASITLLHNVILETRHCGARYEIEIYIYIYQIYSFIDFTN